MSELVRQLFEQFADIIAPARCLVCLREDTWLCQQCAKDLPLFEQRCLVCNQIKPRGATCARHGKKVPLAGVISAGGYSWDHLRRGVHWLKFRGVRAVAPTLAELLLPSLGFIAPTHILRKEAVLTPIPLHRRRLSARGFNQSLAVARSLSEQTGIPWQEILTRQRATASQTDLPHELREDNVAGAFEPCFSLPRKKYFLLVDDVVTTGSTLLSAAACLKTLGVQEVWGVTVARG